MMAYVKCERRGDVVHLDAAGNHPMTLTIPQAGELFNKLKDILDSVDVIEEKPLKTSEGLNPKRLI